MMKKIILSIFLFGLIFNYSENVFAQTITLDEAINIAIEKNPTLQAQKTKLTVNDAQIITARLFQNPKIMTDLGFAESTYRVGLEQTIELGGKIKNRVKVAKGQKEVTETQIITSLLDLRSNVRISYIQLYNLQQKIIAMNEILSTTQRLVDIAKRQEKAGDIANLDVLQTEIVMLKTRNELEQTKLELNTAIDNFSLAVGENFDRNILLQSPKLDKTIYKNTTSMNVLNGYVEEAYTLRPEIRTLQKNIEVENKKIALAKAQRIPDVSLGVGPDFAKDNGKNKGGVFVLASINIPLFDRQQGVIKESQAKIEQYKKEIESQKLLISQEIKNSYFGIINNETSIKIYETELLPKSQTVLNMSELSFKEGKTNILIPLNSQDAYITTKLGYIQTLTEYEKSLSNFERAMGIGGSNL